MYFCFNLCLDQYVVICIVFNPFAHIVYVRNGQTYYVKLVFYFNRHANELSRRNRPNSGPQLSECRMYEIL